MSGDFWYPFYPSRFKSATRHLTAEQDGIYRRLIDEYMETREPLPNNDIALARIAGVNENKWLDAARILRAYFTHNNGMLYHDYCDEMLDIQDKKAKKRSESAKKAAKKRWEKNNKNQEVTCGSHAQRNANAMRGNATDTVTVTKESITNVIESPPSQTFLMSDGSKALPPMQTIASKQVSTTQMHSDGQGMQDGRATTALTLAPLNTPPTIKQIQTHASRIESMIQQGSLTICAETRAGRKPVLDYDGNPYKWEYTSVETGNYNVAVMDESAIDEEAITEALRPCNKVTAQQTLELLAQIKPIGRSEVRQKTTIAMLVYDLSALKISDIVINEAATEWRRATDSDFFPPHGDFLARCVALMEKYRAVYRKIKKLPPRAYMRQEKRLGDFDGDFVAYKKYLESQNNA